MATLSDSSYSLAFTYNADGIRTKKNVTNSSGSTSVYEYLYDGSYYCINKEIIRVFLSDMKKSFFPLLKF